jgi:hypothetical protein
MQRPDSIGPYLHAIDQKLDLIVDQLRRVAETKSKAKELGALAAQWFSYSVPDRVRFDALSPRDQSSAIQVGTQIETLVYWFSTAAQGGTPQAAVATPLALAVHLNNLSVTGSKKNALRGSSAASRMVREDSRALA